MDTATIGGREYVQTKSKMMTVVVIIGDIEWLEPYLVDVPASASMDEIRKAFVEKYGLDEMDLSEAQGFELEPLAAERLAKAEWEETFRDDQAFAQNLHKAIVYAAFAKGGLVKLECLEEEE